MRSTSGRTMGVALVAMAMVSLVAGDAASADRTVLVEYFNATW